MPFLIFFILNTALVSANDDCSVNIEPPKYYLIQKCHRSKLGIAAYANFTSLTSCQRLSVEKRGLAFNFSPPEARDGMDLHSCEVLRCAETAGGSSLVNDTRFDYYSLYARPIPMENSTCMPATGMFHLHLDPLNYTEAVRECKSLCGNLADIIITDKRTEALAQMLADADVYEAIVGMKRHNTSVFSNNNDKTLDCTLYRAWAPGHPRRNFYEYDCMVITRHKTWKTISCGSRYPALCELVPKGPYKKGSMLSHSNRTDIISVENTT